MIATPGDTRTLAEREADYDAFVAANLRRNFTAHFFHGMLGMTGFRLIYAPTFIPTYIHRLTGSDALVGLGSALLQLGAIDLADLQRVAVRDQAAHPALRDPHRHDDAGDDPGHGAGRLVPDGRACCWSSRSALFFLLGAFNGTQRVAFQMLMAKVIPLQRRGRLQAYRNVTGGIIAAALSYAAGRWLIGGNVLGNGYATTFFVAFVLTSMGLTVLRLWMVEPVPRQRPRADEVRRSGARPSRNCSRIAAIAGSSWREACCVAARIGTPFYILYRRAAARPVGHGDRRIVARLSRRGHRVEPAVGQSRRPHRLSLDLRARRRRAVGGAAIVLLLSVASALGGVRRLLRARRGRVGVSDEPADDGARIRRARRRRDAARAVDDDRGDDLRDRPADRRAGRVPLRLSAGAVGVVRLPEPRGAAARFSASASRDNAQSSRYWRATSPIPKA